MENEPDDAMHELHDVVDEERYCINCGEPVRGVPIDRWCAACGTPVALTLGQPLLAEMPPDYLAQVRQGVSLILNSILLSVLLGVGMVGVVFGSILMQGGNPATPPAWPPELMIVVTFAGLGIGVLSLVGYWRFSTFGTSGVPFALVETARKSIRAIVAIEAVLMVPSTIYNLVTYGGGTNVPPPQPAFTGPGLVMIGIGLIGFLLYVVKFLAVMRYTQWLASSVPDPYIVKRAKRYMWLLPVLYTVGILMCGLGPLIALVLFWNLLDRLRKQLKSIMVTGRRAVM